MQAHFRPIVLEAMDHIVVMQRSMPGRTCPLVAFPDVHPAGSHMDVRNEAIAVEPARFGEYIGGVNPLASSN